MKHISFLLLFANLLLAYNEPFDPNDYRQREIKAVRVATPLHIDGRLEEALYSGPGYSDFIQYEPFNGAKASQKTDLWVAYDDAAVYVGARMWDEQPDSIVGRIGRRDAYLNADIFEVIIDSYHDKRTGFSFQINPAGSMRDEVYFNDTWTDDSWDGIWEGKTTIDDKGWTAEMRIPLSQLRFGKQDEYTWGILPTRYIQRSGEWDYFNYFPLNESGTMSRSAELTGIRDIKPSKRREYLPYATVGASHLPSRDENVFIKGADRHFDMGLDMKVGIGANLTVDATINPDFGQVEADPSSINLSDHETYYSEKRPFFVEGRNIFNFGNSGPTNNMSVNFSEPRFFYSRRIGRAPQGWVSADSDSLEHPNATRILGAAKISGKMGENWSIGGITALTNRERAAYYHDGVRRKKQVEPFTSYNLLRTQKQIDDGRYGIGMMGTFTRRFMDGISALGDLDTDHASETILSDQSVGLGLDGWAFLGEDRGWAMGGWAGYSRIEGSVDRMLSLQQNSSHYFQRPDADHLEVDSSMTALTGHAGRIKLNKENGNVLVNLALGWVSPGFETNDLGLTWGTDVINKHINVGYRWLERGKYIRSASASILYANNHDFSGRNTSDVLFGMANLRFTNFWSLNMNGGYGFKGVEVTELRGGPLVHGPGEYFFGSGINTDYRRDFSAFASLDLGYDTDGGDEIGVSMHMNLKLNNGINLSVGPAIFWETDMTQYITSVVDPANTIMFGKRYVVAQLDQTVTSAELRIDYPISPRLTLEGYFQPFIAVGSYSGLKEYVRPESDEFLVYGEDGSSIEYDNGYLIDPTGGSDDDAFSIYDPDFNYKAMVGTLVLRWEFSPGSTMFMVWTHNGTNFEDPGNFDLGRDLKNLANAEADDVFALKLSYWFGQ